MAEMHKQRSPMCSHTARLHSASPCSSRGGERLALGVHKADGQPGQGLRLGQHRLQLLLALRLCLGCVRRVQSHVCRLHRRRAKRCRPSLVQAPLAGCLLVQGMLQRACRLPLIMFSAMVVWTTQLISNGQSAWRLDHITRQECRQAEDGCTPLQMQADNGMASVAVNHVACKGQLGTCAAADLQVPCLLHRHGLGRHRGRILPDAGRCCQDSLKAGNTGLHQSLHLCSSSPEVSMLAGDCATRQ